MISIWDSENKSSLKIDLWTKKMMVEEMKFFTFQILFKYFIIKHFYPLYSSNTILRASEISPNVASDFTASIILGIRF